MDEKLPELPGRDLVWDAIRTVAERLDRKAEAGGLAVRAVRRRSLREWTVTEGLWFGDEWVDGFEAVRARRPFGRRWRDVQTVPDAASSVGRFLRERPDRTASEATSPTPGE